eukprot:gnl/TRDRNA2_/TRDRNA2_55567_c0_seq1.p2 gnl/TRDRNA2_/TRDRNA2_55567_c0~~gnl/TRDRNA2_/TRDRNA2_55567_c0_seq1.p2  ORF type:complete len:146 (+),score=26.52 gnl/TRDRNA2_/TRDRNA2_55567_c0_seq1:33-470(+)
MTSGLVIGALLLSVAAATDHMHKQSHLQPAPYQSAGAHLRHYSPSPAPAKEDPNIGPGVSYFPDRAKVFEGPMKIADLPDQGFEGGKVTHSDKETMIGNWRREFGRKGPDPAPHPVSMPKKAPPKSGAARATVSFALLAVMLRAF